MMDTHYMYYHYMHREKYKYLRYGHTLFCEGSHFAEHALMHSKWCDVYFRATIKDKQKHKEHVARGDLQLDWVDSHLASYKTMRMVKRAFREGFRRQLKKRWGGKDD